MCACAGERSSSLDLRAKRHCYEFMVLRVFRCRRIKMFVAFEDNYGA